MKICVIIPAFNESENLKKLIPNLMDELAEINLKHNVLIVNDGSNDGTEAVIATLAKKYRNLNLISVRTKLGKTNALKNGFEYALEGKYDCVLLMDGDGQDDPKEIKKLILAFNSGFDLTTGARLTRNDRFIKRNTSKIYNYVTSKLLKVPGSDFNSGFKIMSLEVVESLLPNMQNDFHRYLAPYAHLAGFKISEVSVVHNKRISGESKFGINRFWRGYLDLVSIKLTTTYSNRPFHLFGGAGALLLISGSISMAYLIFLKIIGTAIGNRPLLVISVLLITLGFQFIFFGLLTEIVVISNKKSQQALDNISKKF